MGGHTMNLDAFPDELLLEVFSHIADGSTLLDALPCVCKRWHRLSKDPQAWMGVRVECKAQTEDGSALLLARVTLHAPTLRVLAPGSPPSPWMLSALRRNGSLIVRDGLEVTWKDAEEAGISALLFDLVWRSRHYLRFVSQFRLDGVSDAGNGRSVAMVISQLKKIESLDLFVSADCNYNGDFAHVVFPKLRKIRINFAKRAESHPSVESLAADLLRAAGASLRSLTMSTTGKALPQALEDCVVRCERLERLNAPLRDTSLVALHRLDRLKEMALFLHPKQPEETDDEAVACVVEALRLVSALPALLLARLYVYCYQARAETTRLCCQLVANLQSQMPDLKLIFRLV